MRKYTGQSGLIPGLGKVKHGDDIDETKLSSKLKESLKGRLKATVKKEATK